MSKHPPLSESHADLSDLVAELAGTTAPRDGSDAPPPDVWASFLELGLTAVSVGEDLGGSGGTFADEVVLAAESARHGIDVPLVESLVASWVLSHTSAVDARTRTVALVGSSPHSGAAARLPWGRFAEEAIVVRSDGAQALLSPPVLRARDSDVADVPLDEAACPADAFEIRPEAPQYDDVLARYAILRSAQIYGACQAVCDLTRNYVRQREQFGKPLLAIPAVSASLAHMRTHVIQLESALERAVIAQTHPDADPTDRRLTAATAQFIAARAATEVAARGHQLHGAMGITGEYALGAYTRRLWSWRDTVRSSDQAASELGRAALSRGEEAVWTRPI